MSPLDFNPGRHETFAGQMNGETKLINLANILDSENGDDSELIFASEVEFNSDAEDPETISASEIEVNDVEDLENISAGEIDLNDYVANPEMGFAGEIDLNTEPNLEREIVSIPDLDAESDDLASSVPSINQELADRRSRRVRERQQNMDHHRNESREAQRWRLRHAQEFPERQRIDEEYLQSVERFVEAWELNTTITEDLRQINTPPEAAEGELLEAIEGETEEEAEYRQRRVERKRGLALLLQGSMQ